MRKTRTAGIITFALAALATCSRGPLELTPDPARAPGEEPRPGQAEELFVEMSKPISPYDIYARERAFDALAGVLRDEDRWEEVLVLFWKALEAEPAGTPRNLAYRREFGVAAFHLGREDEALQALIDAGEANIAESHLLLGRLLEHRGRVAEAIEAYRHGARGPNVFDVEAQLRLARLLARSGKQREAVDHLIEASPAVGRDRILAQLDADRGWKDVRDALRTSGRERQLAPARSLSAHELGPARAPTPIGRLDPRDQDVQEAAGPGEGPTPDTDAPEPTVPAANAASIGSSTSAPPARRPVVKAARPLALAGGLGAAELRYVPLGVLDLNAPPPPDLQPVPATPTTKPPGAVDRVGRIQQVLALREALAGLEAHIGTSANIPDVLREMNELLAANRARLAALEAWMRDDVVTGAEEAAAREQWLRRRATLQAEHAGE